jgi:hypothetical protein
VAAPAAGGAHAREQARPVVIWYRWQAIAAGILVVYEIVAILWFTDTSRFEFPLGNFLGFFAVVAYIPGLIISLVINQEVLVRRGDPVLSRRERRLIVAEFAAIALSLVLLGIQALVLEPLLVWLVTIVLAVLVFRRLRAR